MGVFFGEVKVIHAGLPAGSITRRIHRTRIHRTGKGNPLEGRTKAQRCGTRAPRANGEGGVGC